MFSFNLSASIGTSLRRSVIARAWLVHVHAGTRIVVVGRARLYREIRGPIILFHGRYALSTVHTIAVTTLLVTVTLCSYGRTIGGLGGSPHSTALRSTSSNVLADSGAVGRYSPVFTVERACSPFGCFLLLAFPPLARLLSIVHTALPTGDNR